MARKSRKTQNTEQMIPQINQEHAAEGIMRLPTAAYVRLSSENSGHETDDTIQTQMALVHHFIREHPELELADTYVDNGYSGTDFVRPEFERMMEDVRRGKIQCIVVKDLSRFGRDYLETGHYLETILPRMNVRFIAITDDFDSMRKEDMESLELPIKNMINSFYAKDISNKLLSCYQQKKQRGELFGTFPPYGLALAEDRKKYIPDEETKAYVRAIFLWRLMGVSKHEIIRRLMLLDAPTPRQRQRALSGNPTEQENDKGEWLCNAVSRILKNRAYAGDVVLGKSKRTPGSSSRKSRVFTTEEEQKVVANSHEAIILRKDFDEVQVLERMNKQEREKALERSEEDRKRMKDSLRGLVYCAECGSRMTFERRGHYVDDMTYNVYHCKTGKHICPCSEKPVQEKLLKILVMDQIQVFVREVCGYKQELQKLTGTGTGYGGLNASEREVVDIKRRIEQTEERKVSLYEDLAAGLLDQEEYRSMREHYIREAQILKEKLNDAQRSKREMERKICKYMELSGRLETHMNRQEFDEDLVHELVERIEVSRNGKVTVKMKFQDAYEEIVKLSEEGAQ